MNVIGGVAPIYGLRDSGRTVTVFVSNARCDGVFPELVKSVESGSHVSSLTTTATGADVEPFVRVDKAVTSFLAHNSVRCASNESDNLREMFARWTRIPMKTRRVDLRT